jgi:dCMP deaminase
MPKVTPIQSIIAYVPVIHRGYIQFFDAFPEANTIYLIDRTAIGDDEVDYLRKDLRQLSVEEAVSAVKGLGRFAKVELYREELLSELDVASNQIILPDEDISRIVGAKFKEAEVIYYGVFLRWDRRSLDHIDKVDPDQEAAATDIKHVDRMNEALQIAEISTDIWRRVGAVLVLGDKITDKASNTGESSSFSPWFEGDPRNAFNRGVGIEMSVFTHAEALLIARAAKYGVSLKGASIYVSDFPCPACAKLVAHSGITKLYYKNGYAVLDGKRVLEDHGVSIQRVIIEEPDDKHPEIWVPYKK